MKYLSSEELKKMFSMQEELNKLYMGEDWRTKWKTGDIKAALLTEMGEFLMETERDWKIWKPNAKFDKSAALFEFIDVVHFMLMGLLYEYEEQLLIASSIFGKDASVPKTNDEYNRLAYHFSYYMQGIKNGKISLLNKIIQLKATIELGAHILYLEPGDIFKGYQMKHAVNIERARGGANYDRSKEKKLELN